MNKEKISSQEIIDLVASKASVSKRAAEEFLKVMITTIEEALMAGDAVKIKGFGTFKLQWNEPRKSVNVQTGEEIILDGFHKVAFAPEISLKDLVNEPFAHLEPVLLDGDNNFVIEEKPEEVALDPLRIFTEQASEIKDLLSEIQALSAGINTEQILLVQTGPVNQEDAGALEDVVNQSEFTDKVDELSEADEQPELVADELDGDMAVLEYMFEHELVDESNDPIEPEPESKPEFEKESEGLTQVEVEPQQEPTIENPIVIDSVSEIQSEAEILEEEETIVQSVEEQPVCVEQTVDPINEELTSEIQFTPFLDGIKPAKKFGKWFWAAIFLLLLSGAGLYLFFPPAKVLGDNVWSQTTIEVIYLKNQVVNTVSGWFTPKPKPVPKVSETVVIPKDTSAIDTVEVAEPIDTLQQLFDNPRVYEEFIASEQINEGSRLTVMSKKYYGNKDFWVYIYEANKERIKNPDHIEMGTLIRIPKLDPKLIDASNPRCIEKARELHDKYVKKKSE